MKHMSLVVLVSHVAETHSIEGKNWMENATHIAWDFRKCHPCMHTKSNSHPKVHFKNCKQHSMENFFRAPLGPLAGKSPGHCYGYWLHFLSCFSSQNFRAFFRAVLTISRRVSHILAHHRRCHCT